MPEVRVGGGSHTRAGCGGRGSTAAAAAAAVAQNVSGTGHPGHVLRAAAAAALSSCNGERSGGWLMVKECKDGYVGEQATGARTALTITNCAEIFSRTRREKFPFDRAGPTPNISFLPGKTSTVIFPAPSHSETHVLFFSEKSPLGFRGALFLLPFVRRVFGRTVRADCFSSRHVRVIWRGGAGARGLVFGLK
jgi:hypothetical protein